MEHKFEYDSIEVVMRSPTVGDRLTRRMIYQKLRRALGFEPGQMMEDDIEERVFEYADIMSKVHSPESAWFKTAGAAPEDLRDGYECYYSMDAELFDEMARAEAAVKPEKKVTRNGSKK